MSNATTRRILLFILLIASQIILFNKIHLFGYVTPLPYIYFIIKLPNDTNRNVILLLSALLGLCVDLLNYTMGINMLACVVIGFLQNSLLRGFAPRDLYEIYSPSVRLFGAVAFLLYVFIMTLLHHILLFTVESLSFFDPSALFFRITGSVVLSVLLIFAFESINLSTSKK